MSEYWAGYLTGYLCCALMWLCHAVERLAMRRKAVGHD